MIQPEAFDAFYKDARTRLLLQTYALTGDLPAARSAVRDSFIVTWHHWRKVQRLPDPEAWVRPHAWAQAQRRHTARIWHRDKSLDPEAKATFDALGKLSLPQRKALVLDRFTTLPLSRACPRARGSAGGGRADDRAATEKFVEQRDVGGRPRCRSCSSQLACAGRGRPVAARLDPAARRGRPPPYPHHRRRRRRGRGRRRHRHRRQRLDAGGPARGERPGAGRVERRRPRPMRRPTSPPTGCSSADELGLYLDGPAGAPPRPSTTAAATAGWRPASRSATPTRRGLDAGPHLRDHPAQGRAGDVGGAVRRAVRRRTGRRAVPGTGWCAGTAGA